MRQHCHAGGGHGPARSCGHWGWLCEPCWAWCLRLVERLCGTEAADRMRTRDEEGARTL